MMVHRTPRTPVTQPSKKLPPRPLTRRRALAGLPWLAGAFAVAPRAAAEARYPVRPITLVVPFAPGGVADITARAVAGKMALALGQAVVVDNRPSAGSIVASQGVAGARPDGYTLLLLSNGHAVGAGLFKRLPYDTLTAFAPISTLGFFDIGLFVPAASRFATLRDLLAFARQRPGELKVATIAVGSTQHLAARLFETVAGVALLIVPYKGTPGALTALRAGEVDLAFEIVGPMVPQVAAGALRALAVSSGQPSPALPGVPTVQQAGVAGYEVASWNALAAPAGTPPAVIATLHAAVVAALASPALHEPLASLGVRVQPSTPQALQALLEAEVKRWAAVIRKAGIEPE